jgi:hypothetical protein
MPHDVHAMYDEKGKCYSPRQCAPVEDAGGGVHDAQATAEHAFSTTLCFVKCLFRKNLRDSRGR